MLTISVDDRAVIARFDAMPAKIRQALLAKTRYFAVLLEQKVKENLYGKLLKYRTGELYGSIFNEVTEDANSVTGKVASSASSKAAPYAAIQEYGGTTKAHVIEAVNGKALAFMMGGKQVFFKRVNHPGSTIPAHRYMGSAFDAMKGDIAAGYEQAVQQAIQ